MTATRESTSTILKNIECNYMSGTAFHTLEAGSSLAECACKSDNEFNRLKNNRRAIIQKKLREKIVKYFPPASHLTYLTLGCGLLLQDYYLCRDWIENGFSLNVILIEPLQEKKFTAALGEFSRRLTKLSAKKNVSFIFQVYTSIEGYIALRPEPHVHVACAIDFDNTEGISDLFLAHQLLLPNGFFEISSINYDATLQPSLYTENWRPLDTSRFTRPMPYFFYTSVLCIPAISEEARKKSLSISQAKQLYEDHLKTSEFAIKQFDKAIGNNLSAGCKEIVKKYVGNF